MASELSENAKVFSKNMEGLEEMDEQTLLDRLNITIVAVETDNHYDTSAKLKIYSLITSLSNSEGSERTKFAKKIVKALC